VAPPPAQPAFGFARLRFRDEEVAALPATVKPVKPKAEGPAAEAKPEGLSPEQVRKNDEAGTPGAAATETPAGSDGRTPAPKRSKKPATS
jgi:hypothetical protein